MKKSGISRPRLSEEFRAVSQVALLGSVPPHVRLIVASIAEGRCLIRMYVDRPVDEDDQDMLDTVLHEIAAAIPLSSISRIDDEIVETTAPLTDLDKLHGAIYKRYGEP